jgi:hypothetical protein
MRDVKGKQFVIANLKWNHVMSKFSCFKEKRLSSESFVKFEYAHKRPLVTSMVAVILFNQDPGNGIWAVARERSGTVLFQGEEVSTHLPHDVKEYRARKGRRTSPSRENSPIHSLEDRDLWPWQDFDIDFEDWQDFDPDFC